MQPAEGGSQGGGIQRVEGTTRLLAAWLSQAVRLFPGDHSLTYSLPHPPTHPHTPPPHSPMTTALARVKLVAMR